MKNSYLKVFNHLFFNLLFITYGFAQWNLEDIGATNNLWDIHFIDNSNGWIVGDNTIYKTEDAGENWTAYNSAVPDTRYYGVYFKDELNGWAVGKKKTSSTAGRIQYTTDGGLTWQVYFTSGSLPWWSVAFAEEEMNGVIVGQEGQALFSTDGGQTWFPRTLPSGNAGIIKDVTFYDGLNAIAVGYDAGLGVIMKTTDGGNTWTNIVTNLEGRLNSVSFSNTTDGIAVGTVGKIYKTSDGGNTWVQKNSNTVNNLNGVSFYNENRIIAVGNFGSIVTSNNNGEDWAEEVSGTESTLRNVNKSSIATAFAVGGLGTVVKDNCVQSGTVSFIDNTASPFISPDLTTESKIYFYYNVEDNENTPPLCAVVEDYIDFNGDFVKMGARYLGNGLLQMWLDFSFDQTPRTLTISIPGSITEDGISINFDNDNIPPNFSINLETRQDVKESISLFAGASIGLSVIEGGIGVGPATIALAKQTLKGSGGMRLKFENDLSGNQIVTRSFEFGGGISAKIPAISSPIPVLDTPDTQLSVTLKGLIGQSMKFSDDGDTTKKAKAAYLLESFGIGGIALNPLAGIYITALKNVLVDLNPDLTNLYSTYHYSDIYGLGAEGSFSTGYNFKFGETNFNLFESAASASLSTTFENFINNKKSLNVNLAGAFNMSSLNLTILDNVDLGNQLNYNFGGKIGITGEYNSQNNQIEKLVLSYSSSESPQLSLLQISKSRTYKFIIPEIVIASNSAVDNIIGVSSDLLTLGTSNKTFGTGVDYFTSNLDVIYADNPATIGTFEDHNLLEVTESDMIGLKENIGIDLEAVIGVGIGITLGMEYSYVTESEYTQSQFIVANDTILPTFENSRNLDDLITLNGQITDLFEGITLLLEGAFDELITTIEQPIEDGVTFLVEIGDSTVELAGNLVSEGEKWILRWLDPTYDSSFSRGPNFQTDVRQVYVSRVNEGMNETNTDFTSTSKLYIVSNNLNANLLDLNNIPIATFDPVSLSLTIDQDKIDELGFTDTEKALAKLYRYDEVSFSWVEVEGDNNPGVNIVKTEITQSANYAIGINYDSSMDLTAPEISDHYPAEGNVIPPVDEYWAQLLEPITGVGLDLSQTIIKVDDIEVPMLWDPINERVLYTPEIPLENGSHTFEVIVNDLIGNTNSVFSNFTVDATLSIDVSDINSFKIYPNPTKDILNLKGNLSILNSVDIYNIQGKHVKSIKRGFKQINISDLNSALYFVKLSTKVGERIVKIIKK